MSLEPLKRLLNKELNDVESCLKKVLKQETQLSIQEINDYLIATPGKRIRPTLVILAFKAIHGTKKVDPKLYNELIQIATAIECIHMASLIHDDVIDHAPIRHKKPSIYAKWGTEVAIPMGVYLYSISLKLITKSGRLDCLNIISNAVKLLCAGELTQVLDRGKLIEIPHYLAILKKKTGILFAASTQCGAILAGTAKKDQYKLKHYGSYLGLSFQIIDDVMDILGNESELKKTPGQDLDLGELTLPLLLLLEITPETEKDDLVNKIFSENTEEKLSLLKEKLIASNWALPESERIAISYLDRAYNELSFLKTSRYKLALQGIITYIKERQFKS